MPGPVTWARQVRFPGRAASPPGAGPGSGPPVPGPILPPSQRHWELLRVPATGYFLHGSRRQLAPQPDAEHLFDALLTFSQRRTASIFLTIKYEPTLNTTALQRRPTWTYWVGLWRLRITQLHIVSTCFVHFPPSLPCGSQLTLGTILCHNQTSLCHAVTTDRTYSVSRGLRGAPVLLPPRW